MTKFVEGPPCDKCGGTKKYALRGKCVPCRLVQTAKYRVTHPETAREYHRRTLQNTTISKKRAGDVGYIGELIVRTDLLLRGLDVTVPENRTCPDDVHFKSSRGWVSVQVKVTQINRNTGHWRCQIKKGREVTSDIMAWVNVRNREIRYAPNTKPVPRELLT